MRPFRKRVLLCGPLLLIVHLLQPAMAGEAAEKVARVLWKNQTGGVEDGFGLVKRIPQGLLAIRHGVVYGIDPRDGTLRWRYPQAQRLEADWDGSVPKVFRGCSDRSAFILRGEKEERLAQISLEDGHIEREIDWRRDFNFPEAATDRIWTVSEVCDGRVVVLAVDQEWKQRQAAVFDLKANKEIARFKPSFPIHAYTAIRGDWLYGAFSTRETGNESGLFSLDLQTGMRYSVPLNFRAMANEPPVFLPTGEQLIGRFVFSQKCAYVGFMVAPQAFSWGGTRHVYAHGIYTSDDLAVNRVDPRTGHPLWRTEIGYSSVNPMFRLAATEETVAAIESIFLHVFDAKTGRLRFTLRTWTDEDPESFAFQREDRFTSCDQIECDDQAAYVATQWGLTAYSLKALEPGKPDPGDPADPAFTLKNARAKLAQGKFRAALLSLSGIASQLRARPELRIEASQLLSQLWRSPEAQTESDLLNHTILHEGWLAGNLFVEHYRNLAQQNQAAAVALLMTGTPEALAQSEKLFCKAKDNYFPQYGAFAVWKRTGKWPAAEFAAIVPQIYNTMPTNDATEFESAKQLLRSRSYSQILFYNAGRFSPQQLLDIMANRTDYDFRQDQNKEGAERILNATRAILESGRKGEGEISKVEFIQPPAPEKPPTVPADF